jgi:hypothetical protein
MIAPPGWWKPDATRAVRARELHEQLLHKRRAWESRRAKELETWAVLLHPHDHDHDDDDDNDADYNDDDCGSGAAAAAAAICRITTSRKRSRVKEEHAQDDLDVESFSLSQQSRRSSRASVLAVHASADASMAACASPEEAAVHLAHSLDSSVGVRPFVWAWKNPYMWGPAVLRHLVCELGAVHVAKGVFEALLEVDRTLFPDWFTAAAIQKTLGPGSPVPKEIMTHWWLWVLQCHEYHADRLLALYQKIGLM